VLEVIQNGIPAIGGEATDAQKTTYREYKKKYCKATYHIHQSISEVNFGKKLSCTSSKDAWNTLERCHTSGAKVKKVKLQALDRKYEHIEMEEQ
ncbi:retrovirus-related pol polyprotein from transposon TNT 1-94, partial [Trifolium medium]|nr:retrovirus-related pol polyprotein from transposon TNT 1-94 [Trifolium medium]